VSVPEYDEGAHLGGIKSSRIKAFGYEFIREIESTARTWSLFKGRAIGASKDGGTGETNQEQPGLGWTSWAK